MNKAMIAGAALLLLAAAGPSGARPPEEVAEAALAAAPVFDGHNDVPEQLRDRRKNLLAGFDFQDTTNTADPAHGLAQAVRVILDILQGHRLGADMSAAEAVLGVALDRQDLHAALLIRGSFNRQAADGLAQVAGTVMLGLAHG